MKLLKVLEMQLLLQKLQLLQHNKQKDATLDAAFCSSPVIIFYFYFWERIFFISIRGQIIRAKNRLLLGARRPTKKKARVSGVRKSGFELSSFFAQRPSTAPEQYFFKARLKILLCTNAEQ